RRARHVLARLGRRPRAGALVGRDALRRRHGPPAGGEPGGGDRDGPDGLRRGPALLRDRAAAVGSDIVGAPASATGSFPPDTVPLRIAAMATLLIVDDEVVLARNLAKAFSGPGFDVHLAASVAEALDRASQHPPDVVLLDLRLPDGSGLDVL